MIPAHLRPLLRPWWEKRLADIQQAIEEAAAADAETVLIRDEPVSMDVAIHLAEEAMVMLDRLE